MVFKKLRKFTKIIMWAIAILIVPAFVIWNVGSSVRDRHAGYAGTIFGKKVPLNEFLKAGQAARNDAWLRYGDKLNEYVNLDEQTWTRLILLREAQARKISVTNEELVNYIKTLPSFTYAQLSPQNYAEIIGTFFRQTPADFEEGIKGTIMMQKLMEDVVQDVRAGDEEVKAAFVKNNEKAAVSYVLLEKEEFLAETAEAPEEILLKFYEEHREEFRKPEQADVHYIEIRLERFKDEIEISEERISRYYEQNKSKFTAEPAEEDQSAPEYLPLEEVKERIKEELTEKEMTDRASELARQILTELYADADFARAAQAHGLNAERTGPFSMFDEIPRVGLSFPFLKAAFSLKPGEISEVIKTPTAYYILTPLKKIEPHIPEFAGLKEQVREAYASSEAEKLARQRAEEIRETLRELMDKENLSFNEAARRLALTVKTAENITRAGYISELGYAQNFADAAFALNPSEISGVVQTPRGFGIMQLQSITPVDEEQFAREKEQYRERVLREKQSRRLNDWFEELKRRANPVSYQEENKPWENR